MIPKSSLRFLGLLSVLAISQCIPYQSFKALTNDESAAESIPAAPLPAKLMHHYAPQEKYDPPSKDALPSEDALPQDDGDALFITPYLKEGKIEEAKSLARVSLPNDTLEIESYSGFFTVNETYKSNMFFWYFAAKENPETAPLLIWLQGRPGGSSLFGLFFENGPYSLDKQFRLVPRNVSWTNEHHVLYFDNPVGTGFSFTTNVDEGYCSDETCVGLDLYLALVQFFELFPDLRQNPLVVTGESYAGKYVPALAHTIHEKNLKAVHKINMTGIAIGDGLIDPMSMTKYGDFFFSIGLVDENTRDLFQEREGNLRQLIQDEEWDKAFLMWDSLVNGDLVEDHQSIFINKTGLTSYYAYDEDHQPEDMQYYFLYLNQPAVRSAIHVGSLRFREGNFAVVSHLMRDYMKSVKPWIEELLEGGYSVVIYNGQQSLMIPFQLTRAFVNSLSWPGAKEYLAADSTIWRVDGEVAGYIQGAKNLQLVMVRDAGTMVPYYQPWRTYDLIRRFSGVHPDGFQGTHL